MVHNEQEFAREPVGRLGDSAGLNRAWGGPRGSAAVSCRWLDLADLGGLSHMSGALARIPGAAQLAQLAGPQQVSLARQDSEERVEASRGSSSPGLQLEQCHGLNPYSRKCRNRLASG